MWVFSTDGFLSIVEFAPPTTKQVKPAQYGKWNKETKSQPLISAAVYETILPEHVDKLVDYVPATYGKTDPTTKVYTKGTLCSHLLVRARVEADLDVLAALDPNSVKWADLKADYQFRLIVSRKVLAAYAAGLVMGIDYDSHVKEEMNKRAPQVAGGRYSAHSAIWSAMARLQPNPPYGHTTTTYVGGAGSTGKYGGHYQSSFGAVEAGGKAKGKEKLPKAARGDGSVLEGLTGDDSGVKGIDEVLADYDAAEQAGYGEGHLSIEDIDELGSHLKWWEKLLEDGTVSRATMIAQLSDQLSGVGELDEHDLDNTVDNLQAAFGTVDLDKVDFDAVWKVIEESSIRAMNSDTTTQQEEFQGV